MRATLVFAVFCVVACAKSEVDDACPNGRCHDGGADVATDAPVDDSGAPRDSSNDTGAHADSASVDSATSDSASSDTGAIDSAAIDTGAVDTGTTDTGSLDTGADTGVDSGVDSGTIDSGADTSTVDTAPPPDTSTGPITGGPCISGATGATAFRIKWVDGGGTATVDYEVEGLPDKTGFKAGAYGYSIGFTPSFVDPFLGEGGLQLDGSDFVDVNLSTVGLSTIRSVTLSIYGRSYDTTTSGSFNWQTFVDVGSTPTDFVSNVAPYAWYSADATSAFTAGDAGALLRIKAGPSSGALVVNRIELCMDAE